MIERKKVLAVITARGSSKGLPGKNILQVGGKPLLAWTIEAAKQSRYIDRLILSSDDDAIIAVALEWECEAPFVRPAELADDTASSEKVALHALDSLGENYDYLVMLQPTSPLRTAADIDACLEKCLAEGAPACVSVVQPDKSPYWMFRPDARGRLQRLIEDAGTFTRRQDCPLTYALNGAVYVVQVPWFQQHRRFIDTDTVGYEMPRERSLDIDDEIDLAVLRALLESDR